MLKFNKMMKTRSIIVLFLAIFLFAYTSSILAQTCANTCSTPQGCTFQGIQNSALGNATLSINGQCQMVVDNIGGSGQDGVVQTNLRSAYMKTTLGTPNFSASITGTSASIRQVGVVDDVQDQEIMLTDMINFDGNNVRHTISCSAILVTGYQVSIYNGNQLVSFQDHGPNPPLLIYPKTDLSWMACGIWPDGSVYSVFQLGSPQPITLQTSSSTPGPFTGDLVFVTALAPQKIPTEQSGIENTFFATGPMAFASVEAGSLPGYTPPCSEGNDPSMVAAFVEQAWNGINACANRGTPVCPAPCLDFPTLEQSGLSPACYNLLGSQLDALALTAIGDTWRLNRCPIASASTCDQARSQAVNDIRTHVLTNQNGFVDGSPNDIAVCKDSLNTAGLAACGSGNFCERAAGFVQALLSTRLSDGILRIFLDSFEE